MVGSEEVGVDWTCLSCTQEAPPEWDRLGMAGHAPRRHSTSQPHAANPSVMSLHSRVIPPAMDPLNNERV